MSMEDSGQQLRHCPNGAGSAHPRDLAFLIDVQRGEFKGGVSIADP